MTNDALSEATWVLEEIGQVLKPVIRTEPGDQLAEELFPNRRALEHAYALVSSLSDPGAQYEILHMESWNSDAYEDWLGRYGIAVPHYGDPIPEGLEPFQPVNCPPEHRSPSPALYGPPGGIRRELLAKTAEKQTEASEDEGSSSSSSSEGSDEEESDELGMCSI